MTNAAATAPVQAQQPPKRLMRNYLLVTSFQLKYTLVIVLVAILIAGGLGTWLWVTWDRQVQISERMVDLGRELTGLASENTKLMMVDAETTADAELSKVLKDRAGLLDARVVALANAREEKAAEIRVNAVRFRFVLFGIMGGLVVVLTIFGILITHRVAGPLFVMTRQFNKVVAGDLVPGRGLRERDELKEFYLAYKNMVMALRDRQQTDIAVLEAALVELGGKEGVNEKMINSLRSLLEQKNASLRGSTPSSVAMAMQKAPPPAA